MSEKEVQDLNRTINALNSNVIELNARIQVIEQKNKSKWFDRGLTIAISLILPAIIAIGTFGVKLRVMDNEINDLKEKQQTVIYVDEFMRYITDLRIYFKELKNDFKDSQVKNEDRLNKVEQRLYLFEEKFKLVNRGNNEKTGNLFKNQVTAYNTISKIK